MTATTSPTLRTEGEIAIPARGLSIRQPWAWAIARGWKPVENRSRAFPLALTGIPIAVHASVRRDEAVFTDLAAAIFTDAATQVLPDPEATRALIEAMRDGDPLAHAYGAVIAVATFTGSHRVFGALDTGWDCLRAQPGLCSAWSQPEHRHWDIATVQPLAQPVPCRGMPGFWPLPASTAEAVSAQINGHQETCPVSAG